MANDQTSGPPPRVIDLTTLRLEQLRTARRELEDEENELSYVRRLLQGRIDIIRAELSRRAGHGTDVLSSLPAHPRGCPKHSQGAKSARRDGSAGATPRDSNQSRASCQRAFERELAGPL